VFFIPAKLLHRRPIYWIIILMDLSGKSDFKLVFLLNKSYVSIRKNVFVVICVTYIVPNLFLIVVARTHPDSLLCPKDSAKISPIKRRFLQVWDDSIYCPTVNRGAKSSLSAVFGCKRVVE